MTSRAKKRGSDFERRVRNKLIDEGYLVMRSAGSFGVFDLIAIAPANEIRSKLLLKGFSNEQVDEILRVLRECIIGIQCKVNGRLSKTEREEMVKLARRYSITPMLYWIENRKLMWKEVNSDEP